MEKGFLKLCVYNLENFFIFIDKYKNEKPLNEYKEIDWQLLSSSIYDNKPIKHVIHLSEIIKREDIDILMLTEVGGVESLNQFNKYFLDNKYTPYMIPGNSDRGIDLAYLVKESLPFTFEITSHKKIPLNFLYPHEKSNPHNTKKTHYFSRDVLQLTMKSNDKEKMILLLVHLKSMLDSKRIDPEGKLRREAEAKALIKIYSKLKKKFSNTPILIGGDFNGGAQRDDTSSEFSSIYKETKLEDVLELCNISPRYTHIFKNRQNKIFANQIDYLFIDSSFKKNIIDPQVYRYEVEVGPKEDIQNLSDRKKDFPSDHFPIITKIKL